mmetsp:Transcript_21156/g.58828  ORF Transcript_21156/g.58828 Transcript_21156/m.58828 type:complete len:302 (-) Transcript_21156:461-1366(-)
MITLTWDDVCQRRVMVGTEISLHSLTVRNPVVGKGNMALAGLLQLLVANDGVHDPIGNTRLGWQGDLACCVLQIRSHALGMSVIDNPSFAQQQEPIQQVENVGPRLVDNQDHGMSQGNQSLEGFDKRECGGCVQSRGGFVANQQGWSDHDLLGQGDPLALASTDRCDHVVPNMQQSEFLHGLLHEASNFDVGGHLEPSREINGLLNGEIAEQEIVLPDDSDHLFGDSRQSFSFVTLIFDGDTSVGYVSGKIHLIGHHGGEAGFAGSRWAHPRSQLEGMDLRADSVQNKRSRAFPRAAIPFQ